MHTCLPMKIDRCEFPDDLLYDEEGFVWARREPSDEVTVGITSIFAAVAGRLTKVQAKATGIEYAKGKTIGTVESGKYFGPIRTPIGGVLLSVNPDIFERPKALSESPYARGWFARLRPSDWEDDRKSLRAAREAADRLRSQIAALRVHCFAALPDYDLFEIGTECAAVLVKLNELLARIEIGEVIHIVSDDWTAPTEMSNWSDQSGQPVIESRKEGNLYHFLVRKVA